VTALKSDIFFDFSGIKFELILNSHRGVCEEREHKLPLGELVKL
jgi:hypothetical protein